MGSPKTPEHKAKIAAALRGREKSPEHKAAISEGLQDFWDSPEGLTARAAVREAARIRRLQGRQDGGSGS